LANDVYGTVTKRLAGLGPMSRGERTVLIVATATALSWVFRKDIEIGDVTVPGWANVFPNPAYIHDGTVAIFFTIVLFMTPVDLKRGQFALDWDWAKRIPWGILLLFGGGLALAKAFMVTGLVEWIGGHFVVLEGVPVIVMILAIATMMTFLTEMTSNTATTNIMLPILAVTAAQVLKIHPLLLMVPATLSASCAFMLPVATPPNAIVFGSGKIAIGNMVRAGLLLNLIGILLITALVYTIAVPVLGIEPRVLPDWAASRTY
jgi:sodium-dependent dicarboxylate transporter 2/3/5